MQCLQVKSGKSVDHNVVLKNVMKLLDEADREISRVDSEKLKKAGKTPSVPECVKSEISFAAPNHAVIAEVEEMRTALRKLVSSKREEWTNEITSAKHNSVRSFVSSAH